MLKKFLPCLTLFSSLGTLVCCALPALFVSLGLGAAVASLVGTFPFLVWLSEHKALVFGLAGSLIALSALIRRASRGLACPADPKLAAACTSARKLDTVALYLSISLYIVGAFFAFVAPAIFS